MDEKISLLKRIDLYLFAKIDVLKQTQEATKTLELFSNLDEEQQKVTKWLMLVGVIFVPFILVFMLWLQNYSLSGDLDMRKKIAIKAQDILAENQQVQDVSQTMLSATGLMDQADLTNRLSTILPGVGVNLSKINISSFDSQNVDQLIKSDVDFKFDNLSNEELVSLFTALISREKFHISSVEIKRNDKSNLVEGIFHGIHLGPGLSGEEN